MYATLKLKNQTNLRLRKTVVLRKGVKMPETRSSWISRNTYLVMSKLANYRHIVKFWKTGEKSFRKRQGGFYDLDSVEYSHFTIGLDASKWHSKIATVNSTFALENLSESLADFWLIFAPEELERLPKHEREYEKNFDQWHDLRGPNKFYFIEFRLPTIRECSSDLHASFYLSRSFFFYF